jgi:hypothetical protein
MLTPTFTFTHKLENEWLLGRGIELGYGPAELFNVSNDPGSCS